MNKSALVAIRDAIPADRNFILATFLRGLYYGDSWFKEIPKNIFMEIYHLVIERLLTKPGVTVKVACLQDDPEVILGYSILERDGDIVHWVFTKSAWRGIGIAKSLVPDRASVATHLTRVGLALLKKRQKMIFNPFVM